MALHQGGNRLMFRYYCLALGLAGAILLTGCGGGTGISNSSNPPSNGGGTQTAPSLNASASTLNFGSIFVDATQAGSITLTNSSTTGQNILVAQLAVSGTGFSLSSTTNFPATIAAGKTLTVNLNFAPQATGNANGSLAITSDASDANLAVVLSGSGIEDRK